MKHKAQVLVFVSLFYLFPVAVYAVLEQADKGEAKMHTYVIFFGFTAQGIENIKQSPARVEAAKEIVKSMGGKMKDFYGILGSQFDTMFILQAPDDETVSKIVLTIASGGKVRTETHRLFTNEEYKKIISELP